MKKAKALLTFLALLCGFAEVNASNLKVDPVRLKMTNPRDKTLVTLTNLSGHKMLIQVNPMDWSQDNGEDIYRDTDALIATPAIVQIEPGEKQVIRFGLRHPLKTVEEKAYRIFFEELPLDDTKKHGITLLLRIGVPLFIKPPQIRSQQLLSSIQVRPGNRAYIHIENQGKSHHRLEKVILKPQGQEVPIVEEEILHYIFPGQSHDMIINLPQSYAGQTLEVFLVTDQG